MIVTPIKTERVKPEKSSLIEFLDRSITELGEGSILVITSKVVALSEGRFLPKTETISEEIIASEADYYLPKGSSPYGVPLTIRDNTFVARAGIDASNTDGVYSLLPSDSYAVAKTVRLYLAERFKIKNIGVIISDSHSLPLRRGVTGVAIGWNGFKAMKAYEDTPDIFGHHFTTHSNIVDALATSAVLTMGEGDERTPLALITEVPFVEFDASSPMPEELIFFKPKLEDDLFAPLLNYSQLKKGQRS
ncbi:MAG: coenzyme F420-0:L-glutamate ligase [Undibacterium sp.]